jgi:isochorismatase family protein
VAQKDSALLIVCVQSDSVPEARGVATDYCVKASVLDALSAGLTVTVFEDGISGVDLRPGDSHAAAADMRRRGAHFTRGAGPVFDRLRSGGSGALVDDAASEILHAATTFSRIRNRFRMASLAFAALSAGISLAVSLDSGRTVARRRGGKQP